MRVRGSVSWYVWQGERGSLSPGIAVAGYMSVMHAMEGAALTTISCGDCGSVLLVSLMVSLMTFLGDWRARS